MHFTNFSSLSNLSASTLDDRSVTERIITELMSRMSGELLAGVHPADDYHNTGDHGAAAADDDDNVLKLNSIPNSGYARLPFFYTSLEILVAIIAIIGNLLVILVFLLDPRLRKVTNFYIISLSLADLLVGAIGIPTAILTRLGIPHDSSNLCITILCFLIILCTISILNLLAVSLDRYWAILHPLDYHKRISGKTALGIICACWILGTCIGLIPLFGWNSSHLAGGACLFIPIMNYDFLMFLYFATIVAPGLLMAFFYIRIYIVVVQQLSLHKIRHMNSTDLIIHSKSVPSNLSHYTTASLNSSNSSTNGDISSANIYRTAKFDLNNNSGVGIGSDKNRSLSYSRREVKKAQKLFVIVVFFMLCWLPLYTSNTIQAFCPSCTGPSSTFLDFLIILSHANSAGSPFLYAFHLKDFRSALRRLIFKGAINQRILRDLRREEMFSISGRSRGQTVSPELPSSSSFYGSKSRTSLGTQKSQQILSKYAKCCTKSDIIVNYDLEDVQEATSSKEY